jgi:hypothetical protein
MRILHHRDPDLPEAQFFDEPGYQRAAPAAITANAEHLHATLPGTDLPVSMIKNRESRIFSVTD